ncbi:MAG: metal-dependent hydrolase [bacterium]
MDIVSHILVSNLVYKELPTTARWLAIVLGTFPDLVSFVGIFNIEFVKKLLFFKRIPTVYFPRYVLFIYNVTHSLLFWLATWMICYFVLNQVTAAIVVSSWGLHIVIDIFTHNSKSNLATRIFWPLSNWHFDGFIWTTKKFLIINYAIIAILYLIFYF